ncbi:hypothetical protein B296_00028062 [Ensete ventricosum]|uniref:Uncharacterized protein n=1 Tax=Ensete ventricosum TaxID=4639 RepID=A0A427A2J0_ENSVE|nr:hypothetical protein B296_00028062 [Ensete ventricosum]
MALVVLPAIVPADIPAGPGFTEAVRQGDRSLRKVFTPIRRLVEFGPENSMGLRPPLSSLVTIAAAAAADVAVPSEQKVYDVILKQSSLVKKKSALTTALDLKPAFAIPGSLSLLKEASDRCGEDCAEYAETFYLDKRIAPESKATAESVYYRAALALGIANQLANILGDVGEE